MRGVTSLNLNREEVAIPAWFAWATPPVPAEEILTRSELALYEALPSSKRRLAFLQGRFCAKVALSSFHSNTRVGSIEITSGVFGQPIVRGEMGDSAEVSISHSRGLAVAVAFARGHCLGIDIEYVDSKSSTFLLDQLTRNERRELSAIQCDHRKACWHIWTAKEALSKTLRCGYTVPLDILELSGIEFIESGRELRARFCRFGQYQARTWSVGSYVMAMVFPRNTAMNFQPGRLQLLAEACGLVADL